MRSLHVIGTLDSTYGGPVSTLRSLVGHLPKFGVDPSVLTLDAPGDLTPSTSLSVPVHAVGPGSLRLGAVPYHYTSQLLPWLRGNQAAFDVVVVHGIWQYQSFGTWRALRKTGKPVFVFVHGALDPWFKRQYPRKHLKKWLYWPWAEYRVLRDATAVLFTSEDEKILARESFWLYRCNERVVSYGANDPAHLMPADASFACAAYPELAGNQYFLYLSRIHEKKGCDLLLRAFKASLSKGCAHWLVMAGPVEAEYLSFLQGLATELKVADRVIWPGMVTGELKWSLFRGADAFVLPSHSENFGVAVAEAMAAGVPVLTTNRVNIWREIDQDQAGFIDDDTLEGTERLLNRWLSTDAQTRDSMRANARACFKARFDMVEVTRKFAEMLKEYCGKQ